MSLKVVLLVLVFGASVWCRHVIDPDGVTKEAENFQCDKPQPRAFSVWELTKFAYRFSEPYVVLYRCDRAGCCASLEHSCAPLKKENVTIIAEYYNGLDESEELELTAENHLSCECRSTVRPK